MGSRDRIEDHPEELDLLDYLSGQLPREASDQIRRHVGQCRACQRTMGDLSVTVDELDRLPTISIPHDSLYAPEPSRTRARTRLVGLPGVAILVAGVAAISAVLADGGGNPTAPSSVALTMRSATGFADTVRHVAATDASGVRIAYDFTAEEWVVVVPGKRFAATVAALRALPRGDVRVVVATR